MLVTSESLISFIRVLIIKWWVLQTFCNLQVKSYVHLTVFKPISLSHFILQIWWRVLGKTFYHFPPFLQTEELIFADNFCFIFSSLLLFVCHKRNDVCIALMKCVRTYKLPSFIWPWISHVLRHAVILYAYSAGPVVCLYVFQFLEFKWSIKLYILNPDSGCLFQKSITIISPLVQK